MKIILDIPIEEFDFESYYDDYDCINHSQAILDVIIEKAAMRIVDESRYSYKQSISEMVEEKTKSLLEQIKSDVIKQVSQSTYKAIQDKIADKLVAELSKKYERSQQYREIKKQFEIENDRDINNGMKTLISDIVKSEVKKIIKL